MTSGWASFIEGIECKLQGAPNRLFLLARPLLVVNQLAHHLAPARELLSGGLEVVRHSRVVTELEISESVGAFRRQRLRIERQGVVAFTNESCTDHAAVELPVLPHRHHRVAD